MRYATPAAPSRLQTLADETIRSTSMDCAGLYRFDPTGAVHDSVTLGLPEGFATLYETVGQPIDPVLSEVCRTGVPASTETLLGSRWSTSELYRRVGQKFGMLGFAAFPLYEHGTMSGILFLGALREGNRGRLGYEGLCHLGVLATRISSSLSGVPRLHIKLTPRQHEVAALAAEGLSNRDIARALGTGEASVRKHMKTLNQIFETRNRTAMASKFRNSF